MGGGRPKIAWDGGHVCVAAADDTDRDGFAALLATAGGLPRP
jgi:hypothetical protein